MGFEEPTQKILLCLVTMLVRKCHLVLIEDESKGLQNSRKVVVEEEDTPGELRMARMSVFGQHFILFLDGPAKNQQAFISRKYPKTLWKCLWTTHKNLLKTAKLKL